LAGKRKSDCSIFPVVTLKLPKTVMKKLPLTLLTIALIGWTGQVKAATFADVELAFLIDSSDSISNDRFNQELQAYINIFTNDFYNRFVAPLQGQNINGRLGEGRVAVAAFKFGGTNAGNAFQTIADWTIISNQTEADDFGNQFVGQTKIGGQTPLGFAIQSAADTMFDNEIDGAQLVMDISSDGLNFPPSGLNIRPLEASNYARCAGDLNDTACVTDPMRMPAVGGVNVINSISIGSSPPVIFEQFVNYGTNLSGSNQNAFLASSLDEYQTTLDAKLTNELTPDNPRTPEPSLIVGIIGLGILGIGNKWTNRHR
jgi:hypothetical protein